MVRIVHFMSYLFYHNKKEKKFKVLGQSSSSRVLQVKQNSPELRLLKQCVMLVLILVSSEADPGTRIRVRQFIWDVLGIPVGDQGK